MTATVAGIASQAKGRRLPGPDSVWWVIAVGVLFVAAELLFVSAKMGLSWDETVYVSQVSGHGPAAWFDPARARGVPLLAAPVAYLTGSIVALRVYLAVLSGIGLVLALLVWRPLRSAWVLALAGVAFGGLWVAQYYGPQAMPDMWSALGALAAVGFFLRRSLVGLAGCMGFVTLVRPGDAVYLAVPLLLAVGVVRSWRQWRLAAAVTAGLVVGGAEWMIEAVVRFGGVFARLHAAGAEQSGFGLHFALLDELRALNGPTLCRPCTIGYRQPVLDLWWLVLPVLAALGVVARRRAELARGGTTPRTPRKPAELARGGTTPRTSLPSALLPVVCGLCLAAQYLFMIDYAAPRFLLPAYAVLSIPVADGVAWLICGVRLDLRPAMVAVVACLLVAQLAAQHVVLDHEAGGTVRFHDDYSVIAARISGLGVRPPCLVSGVQYIPIGFYAGCASAGQANSGGPGAHVLLIETGHHPPPYARGWRSYLIRGTTVLRVTVYICVDTPRMGSVRTPIACA